MGRAATDKRDRLVTAAIERFHQQGYARTSLAEVAKTASVAPGNVFYYFKTKEDLARAVVDEWCRLLAGNLAALDAEPDPWRRLEGFIEQAYTRREMYVVWGCPLGGLTRDLRQENDVFKRDVARIYGVQFAWLRAQFEFLGFHRTVSKNHSRFLLAGYQGAILLAFAQNDGAFIDQEATSLKSWLTDLRRDLSVCKANAGGVRRRR